MFKTLAKMSPDCFRCLMEQVGLESAIQVTVHMASQGAGKEEFPDGRTVFLEKLTLYKWKKGDTQKLLTLSDEELRYVETIRIYWEDDKSLHIDDWLTKITLHGFYEFPFRLRECLGDFPSKIILQF